MKRLLRPSILVPVIFFAGLMAIAAGVAMVYPPAGVILAGTLLVAGAAAYETNHQRQRSRHDENLTSELE